MLPSSLTVSLSISLLGLLTVAVFLWAWFSRQFDDIDGQAMLPLDEDDMSVQRPWETASQRAARVERWGPPTAPLPGAWGGRA